MGLGLHGGGLAAARFLAKRGAEVTVTDLRDEATLEPSLRQLDDFRIRTVLGRHEMSDFSGADFVVKNPAVRPDSPYLVASRRVETDLSLFLRECPARILAVTGSKGKSSVSSALHWGLGKLGRRSFLGGNITVSPLNFLEELSEADDVVLELSSWQLGDLRGRVREDGRLDEEGRPEALLKPRVALLTAIMPDHQDRYGSMEAYVADKRVIYAGQDRRDATICGLDAWGDSFAAETRGRALRYGIGPLPPGSAGAWMEPPVSGAPGSRCFLERGDGAREELLPERLAVPGAHQRMNLLSAALALSDLGFPSADIASALSVFPGIEHRLEFFAERHGVRFYNDTAATIPEAAAAALGAFREPVVLVCGGTDKALDFEPLARAAASAKALVLLAGTGSDKLTTLLDAAGLPYAGPYGDLDAAVAAAIDAARPGDVVVLSPGCASFGMFLNEFDRGKKWKETVLRAAGAPAP